MAAGLIPRSSGLENALAEMVLAGCRRLGLNLLRLSQRAGCELGTVVAVVDASAESKPLGEVKRILRVLELEVTFGGRDFHVIHRRPVEIAFRRWHWRTWNLLLQIQQATDGKDPRQASGEMTERTLGARADSRTRAFLQRGWVRQLGVDECADEDAYSGISVMPTWEITDAGRRALVEARELGVEIQ